MSKNRQKIYIKENLSSVTNNEIRDSEFINSTQSNKFISALTAQDIKVNSLINNTPMDNSTQLEESNISKSTKKEKITILSSKGESTISTKKMGAKRFSTRRSKSTKKMNAHHCYNKGGAHSILPEGGAHCVFLEGGTHHCHNEGGVHNVFPEGGVHHFYNGEEAHQFYKN